MSGGGGLRLRGGLRAPGAGLRRLGPLLHQARYEVLPTASAEAAVMEFVPREVTVTVTASPSKGLEPTLALTERLTAAGFSVVPHLSARLVRDAAHLAEIAGRLTAAGVSDVFVPAGDAESPAGAFTSALDVLEELAKLGDPFARVGITGYPETHPKIDDDVTVQAMWDKRRHASYIVSNLCFDPAVLRQWITRIRRRGVTLPLLLGLAGPVDRAKLLQMATKIGVADSARFAAGHGSAMVRLSTPGAYQPERLLDRLSPVLAAPDSIVTGLHLFTFNQVRQAEEWRQALLAQIPDPASR
ncbi:MAG TPA: methylenetetrahydrofolate reductase [Streptosporangiaceae bacterium]